MKKDVTFTVDADIYEKFCIALNLTEETQDDAAENCMRWYIAKTFEKASQTYNPRTAAKQSMKIKILQERQYRGFLYGH